MCVSACGYVYINAGAYWGQERALDSLVQSYLFFVYYNLPLPHPWCSLSLRGRAYDIHVSSEAEHFIDIYSLHFDRSCPESPNTSTVNWRWGEGHWGINLVWGQSLKYGTLIFWSVHLVHFYLLLLLCFCVVRYLL